LERCYKKALQVSGLSSVQVESLVRGHVQTAKDKLKRQSPTAVVQNTLDVKDDGNREYMRKQYPKALDSYVKGGDLIKCIIDTRGSGGRMDTDCELISKCIELTCQLEGYCALMFMELGQFVRAKHVIKSALTFDPRYS